MEGSMTAVAPRRAVGLIRVSQVNGREGDSFHSPETQRKSIERACADRDWRLVAVHDELDVSAGKPLSKRPGLRRAVEAVEVERADVVIVAYFDRLLRNLEVQMEVVKRVEAASGDIETIDFGKVTNGNATQRLTSNFLGAVAQYHRDISAEKSREAQAVAIARGVAPWPLIPPGYVRAGDGVLTPDPQTRDAVAEAFQMRADGATVASIREHLARHGIVRSYHGTTALLESRVVLGELEAYLGHAFPFLRSR
jgi:site-specific DNA recombinase